jgi:NAD+ synthase
MRQQMTAAGARGLVVGLSGGVDSAVVARLAQLAAPSTVVAALLPCHSDPIDDGEAAAVAAHFALTTIRIDLSSAYDELTAGSQAAMKSLPTQLRALSFDRRPTANIQSRLRMTALYVLADSLKCLVVGTSSRAAIASGRFTKYSDGGVDLQPIGRLSKREVRSMARDLSVPAQIIARVPSGPSAGHIDEKELGFSDDELDRYLDEGPESVAPATALKIERLIRSTEHKWQMPAMPEE